MIVIVQTTLKLWETAKKPTVLWLLTWAHVEMRVWCFLLCRNYTWFSTLNNSFFFQKTLRFFSLIFSSFLSFFLFFLFFFSSFSLLKFVFWKLLYPVKRDCYGSPGVFFYAAGYHYWLLKMWEVNPGLQASLWQRASDTFCVSTGSRLKIKNDWNRMTTHKKLR